MSLTYLGLETLPRLYDIVWCRFPEHTSSNEPAVKVRPALVRVSAKDQATGHGLVQVAYGTTNLKIERRRLDLVIMNSKQIDECGLSHATRFDLDRLVYLPWCLEYFRPPSGLPSAHIGKLNLQQQMRLKRLGAAREEIARISAERDS